jgi:hypothetical protein
MRQAITGVLIPFLLTGISHGQTSCDADLNGDLVVNLEDLLGMLVHYGDSCAITQIIHPTLVVSEIHYNPNSLQGNDSDWEFLELFNPNENVIPLQGWMLSDAVSHSFTEMDSIGAFSFFVVARNADTLSTVVAQEIGLAEWNSGGGLNNTGGTITLLNPGEEAVVSISYEDNDGWIETPDGEGPSLELMDFNLPNAEVASWAASFVFGGTPGMSNSMWGLSDTE